MHIGIYYLEKTGYDVSVQYRKEVLPASHHADFLSERNSRLPLMFSVLFSINTTEYTFSFKMAERNQCSGFHHQANA